MVPSLTSSKLSQIAHRHPKNRLRRRPNHPNRTPSPPRQIPLLRLRHLPRQLLPQTLHRPRRRRLRSHILLPRIPLHRRILPPQTPLRHPATRPLRPRHRRNRLPTPQTRKSLHPRRQTLSPGPQIAIAFKDPSRYVVRAGGNHLRAVCLRAYEERRRDYPEAGGFVLGPEIACAAS